MTFSKYVVVEKNTRPKKHAITYALKIDGWKMLDDDSFPSKNCTSEVSSCQQIFVIYWQTLGFLSNSVATMSGLSVKWRENDERQMGNRRDVFGGVFG